MLALTHDEPRAPATHAAGRCGRQTRCSAQPVEVQSHPASLALAAGNAASKASQFVVYPEAPHAFHADYRPSYRKDAAEDGWKRCLAWFKANGVA